MERDYFDDRQRAENSLVFPLILAHRRAWRQGLGFGGSPFLPGTLFNLLIIKGPGSTSRIPSPVAGIPLPLSYFPILLFPGVGT